MHSRSFQLKSLRGLTICVVAVWVSVTSGCQMGRRWFQLDSNSRSPMMGLELRADASAADGADAEGLRDASGAEVLPVQHIEEEPRRGLRDWLGLQRGEEQIPLPTTIPTGDEGDGIPLTGPHPEF